MRLIDLPAAVRNPKKHALSQVDASMERFGYTEPVLLDERTGRLVAGHGRVETLIAREAAGQAAPEGVVVDPEGKWTVPVVRGWESSDDQEAEAYLVASNRLTELGGWDSSELADMLAELDKGAGLIGTGYTPENLTDLLASLRDKSGLDQGDPATRIEMPVDTWVVRGDIWSVGEHRVMCGDCRDPADVAALVGDTPINLAFTSPPYAEQREYDTESGFVPIRPDDYVEWFAAVASNVAAHLAEDGSWFVNIKPTAEGLDTLLYVYDLVLAHVREWGWHLGTEFCWERSGVPKQVTLRFKNQFEPIYQFARGRWKIRPEAVRHHTNSAIVPLGEGALHEGSDWSKIAGAGMPFFKPEQTVKRQRGGTTGNVAKTQGQHWAPGEAISEGLAYPGNRLPTFAGSHTATGHPAAFPVGLPQWFVLAYTDRGDAVYDPFLGSGSTALAAANLERCGMGMELSPVYAHVALARLEAATGLVPKLIRTGSEQTFLSGADAPHA